MSSLQNFLQLLQDRDRKSLEPLIVYVREKENYFIFVVRGKLHYTVTRCYKPRTKNVSYYFGSEAEFEGSLTLALRFISEHY